MRLAREGGNEEGRKGEGREGGREGKRMGQRPSLSVYIEIGVRQIEKGNKEKMCLVIFVLGGWCGEGGRRGRNEENMN